MGIFPYRAIRAVFAATTDDTPTYTQHLLLSAIDRVIDEYEGITS